MERTFEEDARLRADVKEFILTTSHDCARRLRAGGVMGWTVGIKMRGTDFHTITRSVGLMTPTDMERDIAQAAQGLFTREDIPIGRVRLFGVHMEGLQAHSGGVVVTLDCDERPAVSGRAMDQVRDRFGTGALAPATLLGKRTPGRRLLGGDSDEAGVSPTSPDARAYGQGSNPGNEESTQGTFL